MNRDSVWAIAERMDMQPLGLVGIDGTWSAFRPDCDPRSSHRVTQHGRRHLPGARRRLIHARKHRRWFIDLFAEPAVTAEVRGSTPLRSTNPLQEDRVLRALRKTPETAVWNVTRLRGSGWHGRARFGRRVLVASGLRAGEAVGRSLWSGGLRLEAQNEGILLGRSPAVRRSRRIEDGRAAGSLAIGEGGAVVPPMIGAVPAAVPDALAPRRVA